MLIRASTLAGAGPGAVNTTAVTAFAATDETDRASTVTASGGAIILAHLAGRGTRGQFVFLSFVRTKAL
ncbi:hypothetical protein [Streptomyces vietnamensis]|uniref:hypothetical protein n=1 Tax=Streptomyces vietnamensis TaxID=362257 RepID=UPI003446FBA0